nr:aldehyde dehydrogenase family protein [Gluconobacter sp. P1C6_b]
MCKALPDALEEIDVTTDILSFHANGAEEFSAPTPLQVKTGQTKIINQPLGIIYCIEPWNFPYYQLAHVAGPWGPMPIFFWIMISPQSSSKMTGSVALR